MLPGAQQVAGAEQLGGVAAGDLDAAQQQPVEDEQAVAGVDALERLVGLAPGPGRELDEARACRLPRLRALLGRHQLRQTGIEIENADHVAHLVGDSRGSGRDAPFL